MKRNIILIVSFIFMFRCAAKMPPIKLPDTSQFVSIIIESRWDKLDGEINKFTISEKDEIIKVHKLLKVEERDWHRPYDPVKPFAWRMLIWLEGKKERHMV